MKDNAPLERRTLLRVLVGSHGHGTATPSSDRDVREVFLLPTRRILSLSGFDNYVENPVADENGRELLHFLRLALRCNPTVLEVLVAPVELASAEGEELRRLFPRFLARGPVKSSFLGFANGQSRAMRAPGPSRQQGPKAMAHYLRVLFNGIELLKTGAMTMRIADTAIGPLVLAAKRGEMPLEEALERGRRMEQELLAAYAGSQLPEQPDHAAIEEFHLRIRAANW